MGVEYQLVKPGGGAAYELGKAAMRPPAQDWRKRAGKIDPIRDMAAWQAVMLPSKRAMWSIGSATTDCELTVLSERWTLDALTDAINIAIFQEDDIVAARRIAQDLLEWAGDDAVVLIPDALDLDHVSQRIGVAIARPRTERSVYDPQDPA